ANIFVSECYNVRIMTWTKEKYEKDLPFEVIRNPIWSDVLKEYRWADVVLENNPTLRLSWPLLIFKKPLIIVLHTWINRINNKVGWQDILKRLWLKRATMVIAVSNAFSKKYPVDLIIANPYNEN